MSASAIDHSTTRFFRASAIRTFPRLERAPGGPCCREKYLSPLAQLFRQMFCEALLPHQALLGSSLWLGGVFAHYLRVLAVSLCGAAKHAETPPQMHFRRQHIHSAARVICFGQATP